MARAVNWSAVQNHSEPGPMSANPSVLMSVTTTPSLLLLPLAGRYARLSSRRDLSRSNDLRRSRPLSTLSMPHEDQPLMPAGGRQRT